MDASNGRDYTFCVSWGRSVKIGRGMKRFERPVWRGMWRFLPPKPSLNSWEAQAAVTLWAVAALATLWVAFMQGLEMFVLSSLAVGFGSLAALWLLNGARGR